MLGQHYFAERLGDIYSLSPLPYQCGSGRLASDAIALDVDWELNASITGDCILALSSQKVIGPNLFAAPGRRFRQWELSGYSRDGEFSINSQDIGLSNLRWSAPAEGESATYFAHFNLIRLERAGSFHVSSIRGLARNLAFAGIESTDYGSQRKRDQFTCRIAGRDVTFQQRQDVDDVKRLIEIERIEAGLMSSVTIPLLPNESPAEGAACLESIEWILAFVTRNRTFCPFIRMITDNEICGWQIHATNSSRYKRDEIIDNHIIPTGIRSFLESQFDNFLALDQQIDLRRFVDMTLVMGEQRQPEFMLAGLLLCIEYLCTKLLDHYGTPMGAESNVQQKLNRLNNHLRFIPKNVLDDELRADIRNPLFHQGALVGASVDTLWEWYVRYWELLVQIFFVALGYSGNYLSREDHSVKVVPASASPNLSS